MFRANGKEYRVCDISEEGLRFKNNSKSGLSIDESVAGTLNFRDGETFLLRGTISRVSADDVILKLKTPIPLRKIMEEQRLIIGRFPKKAI